ncbi:hypothetical protein BJ944DRAFT_260344 [Cunninghamella echinulata]|nr:hypothetical protein BJ944DRAFT_260344 [Cunninghamella echinulata]
MNYTSMSCSNSTTRQPLSFRKNACLICSICFTCSKVFGVDCSCDNIQPRRGRNLPGGSLDSRAKKLNPMDSDDYDFSIDWLTQNAHIMYKDNNNQVIGLLEANEVSLCKAHSSTLYRAKKRHLRRLEQQHITPPSPTDSSTSMMDPVSPTTPFLCTSPPPPYPHQHHHHIGGLAAKVKELQHTSSSPSSSSPSKYDPMMPPDFTTAPSTSTSIKRKRTCSYFHPSPHDKIHFTSSSCSPPPPISSASTPLLNHSSLHNHSSPHHHRYRCTSPITTKLNDPFSNQQLPPIQRHPPSHYQSTPSILPPFHLMSLSSNNHHHHHHHHPSSNHIQPIPSLSSNYTFSPHSHSHHHNHQQQLASTFQNNTSSSLLSKQLVIETVSLKTDLALSIRPYIHQKVNKNQSMPMEISDSSSSSASSSTTTTTTLLSSSSPSSSSSTSSTSNCTFSSPTPLQHLIHNNNTHYSENTIKEEDKDNNTPLPFYFIKNLAITDTFTFYQLLEEIEMNHPPPGKRIIILNDANDIIYPLHEPIRSVLKDPKTTHVDLCIGVRDKPSIDWSSMNHHDQTDEEKGDKNEKEEKKGMET